MSTPQELRRLAMIVEGKQVTESVGPGSTPSEGGYTDSAEFTDEFYGALQQLDAIAALMDSGKMSEWMDVTDQNFDTNCAAIHERLGDALYAAQALFNQLSDELERAA